MVIERRSEAVQKGHGTESWASLARPVTVTGRARLAWHYVRYSDDAALAAAEVEAREARRGLWADREPVPPWEWRAGEQARKAAAPR